MTPSTPHRDSPYTARSAAPATSRAFTLTEMLVVIGMIVLVLGIATPMVTRAWRAGDRTRTAADLAAIASALEAYRQDHGSYPQVGPVAFNTGPNDYNGARMLCRALIGPGPGEVISPTAANNNQVADGAGSRPPPPSTESRELQPGPGFRTRGTSGRVYGPYLKPESFKLADPSSGAQTAPGYLAFLDRYNRPFLYYPANSKPNIRLAKSYAWDRTTTDKPMYNALDNWSQTTNTGAMDRLTLARMLGDTNANGMIDPSVTPPEEPAYEGPYLLWSSGPDEVFGPPTGMLPTGTPPPDKIRKAVEKSDDITNFRN